MAKADTSTLWLRRRSTCCCACGLNRAIRQAILLVPTSSAAISAERFGDKGLVLGVKPNWRTLMRGLLSTAGRSYANRMWPKPPPERGRSPGGARRVGVKRQPPRPPPGSLRSPPSPFQGEGNNFASLIRATGASHHASSRRRIRQRSAQRSHPVQPSTDARIHRTSPPVQLPAWIAGAGASRVRCMGIGLKPDPAPRFGCRSENPIDSRHPSQEPLCAPNSSSRACW